jgi:hypothetical protein
MELYVLSDKRLASIDDWQRAIDSEGFPLRLSAETPFDHLKGLLPARLRDAPTGFECDQWDAGDVLKDYADVDFGRVWTSVLAFRWLGSNFAEMEAAWMASSAYARATDGVVFDLESGEVLTSSRAVETARGLVDQEAHVKAAVAAALKKLGLQP